MKRRLIYWITILLISCAPESQNKHLSYQNIIILADLSSRLENKPPKDIEEIDKIVDYFKRECVKPGEKIGDKSCISFAPISEKTAAIIDINQIKNLEEKQCFINSTGQYKDNGLEEKLQEFKKTIVDVYSTIRNPGLDLISMLIEKVENEPIIRKDIILTDGLDTTFINYNNHIYIFTDGYLEYKKQNAAREFYFGNEEIEAVRQYCIANRLDVKTALNQNQEICLPLSETRWNKYINLHIMETHERDKDPKFQTYSHIRGLRDNDILEAVWSKWAHDSGFKNFEWNKY